jgi:hypothetical protein
VIDTLCPSDGPSSLPPPAATIEDGHSSSPQLDLPLHRYLAQNHAHRIDTSFPGVRLLNEEPYILAIPGFISPDECAMLISLFKRDAAAQRPSDGADAGLARRTSMTVFPPAEEVRWLRERIARATAVAPEQLEPTKLTHYGPGDLFAKHSDASFLNEKLWAFAARLASVDEEGVQEPCEWPSRFVTLFLYLNDVPPSGGGRTRWRWLDGGSDAMPGANIFAQAIDATRGGDGAARPPSTADEISLVPRAGTAIVHFPCTCTPQGGVAGGDQRGGSGGGACECVPDPRAMHESEPTAHGAEKFILQQFIWPVAVDPTATSAHEDVRREWAALMASAGAAAPPRVEAAPARNED